MPSSPRRQPLWDEIAAIFILALHIGAIITAAAYSILKLPEDTLLYLCSGILFLWFIVNIFLVRVFMLSENKQLPDYLYERAYFAPAIFLSPQYSPASGTPSAPSSSASSLAFTISSPKSPPSSANTNSPDKRVELPQTSAELRDLLPLYAEINERFTELNSKLTKLATE